MSTGIKLSISFMSLVFLITAGAANAGAQSVAEARTWTVSPFLGTSMGLGDPANNDSLGLGVSVEYDWTPNLGFEGELGHLFDVAGDTDAVDWSITNFSANAVYHFDVKRVTPYATFGIGFERSAIDVKNPEALALTIPSATEIAYNFGGGVKYPITSRLLARGDLRRVNANDQAPDFWRLYGGLTFRVGR